MIIILVFLHVHLKENILKVASTLNFHAHRDVPINVISEFGNF